MHNVAALDLQTPAPAWGTGRQYTRTETYIPRYHAYHTRAAAILPEIEINN